MTIGAMLSEFLIGIYIPVVLLFGFPGTLTLHPFTTN
uniref:Uncharacterized protein n=1 Tax=Arundo donax TaxID=35708 RepID=A0A0A8Z9F1_ARUDO